jgi:hypothetical protein
VSKMPTADATGTCCAALAPASIMAHMCPSHAHFLRPDRRCPKVVLVVGPRPEAV